MQTLDAFVKVMLQHRCWPEELAWGDSCHPLRWSGYGTWVARTLEGCRSRPSRGSQQSCSSPWDCLTLLAVAHTKPPPTHLHYIQHLLLLHSVHVQMLWGNSCPLGLNHFVLELNKPLHIWSNIMATAWNTYSLVFIFS